MLLTKENSHTCAGRGRHTLASAGGAIFIQPARAHKAHAIAHKSILSLDSPVSSNMALTNLKVLDPLAPYLLACFENADKLVYNFQATRAPTAVNYTDRIRAYRDFAGLLIGDLPFVPESLLDKDAYWIVLVAERARLAMFRLVCKEFFVNEVLMEMRIKEGNKLKVMVWKFEVGGCKDCVRIGKDGGTAVGVRVGGKEDGKMIPDFLVGPGWMIAEWGEVLSDVFPCKCNEGEDEIWVGPQDEMVGMMALVPDFTEWYEDTLHEAALRITLGAGLCVMQHGVMPGGTKIDSLDEYKYGLVGQKWCSPGEAAEWWKNAIFQDPHSGTSITSKRQKIYELEEKPSFFARLKRIAADKDLYKMAISGRDSMITCTKQILVILATGNPQKVNHGTDDAIDAFDFFSRFLEDLQTYGERLEDCRTKIDQATNMHHKSCPGPLVRCNAALGPR